MQIVTVNAATTIPAGQEFTLQDLDVNKNGETRMAVVKGANFAGTTLTIEVNQPGTSNWYTTGVSIAAEADAGVILLRANYKYRVVPAVAGGALNVSLMFF